MEGYSFVCFLCKKLRENNKNGIYRRGIKTGIVLHIQAFNFFIFVVSLVKAYRLFSSCLLNVNAVL